MSAFTNEKDDNNTTPTDEEKKADEAKPFYPMEEDIRSKVKDRIQNAKKQNIKLSEKDALLELQKEILEKSILDGRLYFYEHTVTERVLEDVNSDLSARESQRIYLAHDNSVDEEKHKKLIRDAPSNSTDVDGPKYYRVDDTTKDRELKILLTIDPNSVTRGEWLSKAYKNSGRSTAPKIVAVNDYNHVHKIMNINGIPPKAIPFIFDSWARRMGDKLKRFATNNFVSRGIFSVAKGTFNQTKRLIPTIGPAIRTKPGGNSLCQSKRLNKTRKTKNIKSSPKK